MSITIKKAKTKWVCKECGNESSSYLGKCPHCNSWGSLKEIAIEQPQKDKAPKHGLFVSAEAEPQILSEIPETEIDRFKTGFSELDRVMGGGIVPGSISLIGGSPGIGKSTLLLQAAANINKLNEQDSNVLYISAEESSQQIKLRASRLNLPSEDILVYTENNLEKIVSKVKELEPKLLIVDSIQAIYLPAIDSIPGSITQIRETASNLTRLAKSTGVPIIVVGHINKDGDIAGPKVLEHVVDTVLQFEGEKDQQLRILRAIKNRFGSTDEVGLFDMSHEGLKDLLNPSEIFLKQRSDGVVFATKEGNRSLLLELQSLIAGSEYNNPRRLANGIDNGRLHQILAVLENKVKLSLSKADVYINVVGGLSIKDPAADLAIALSVYLSIVGDKKKIANDFIALGEIGLSGEVRAISNLEARLKEAQKLGFKRAIVPQANLGKNISVPELQILSVRSLRDAINSL